MAVKIKMLGQLRPADTNAATLYTKAQDAKVWVDYLLICNTTGTAATCRVFIDNAGSTYDQTTAIYYDKSVAANDTLTVDFSNKVYLSEASSSIGVATGTNDALTFTLFGEELF